MYIKMIFVGTEEVHCLTCSMILKINFVQTKEKRYNPTLLLTERRFLLVQSLLVILLVKNSESKKLDLDLAKALAKMDVVRKTVSKREKMVEST